MPWQDYKPYVEPLDCFREQDEQLHINFDPDLIQGWVSYKVHFTTCFGPDDVKITHPTFPLDKPSEDGTIDSGGSNEIPKPAFYSTGLGSILDSDEMYHN
jgi:hypothetical protein